MSSTRNAPSYETVVATLRLLFANSPEPDVRPVKDIYVAVGRDLSYSERNKSWLTNKMTHIRRYGLADSIRSAVNHQTVEYVKLTAKGKQVLSGLAEPQGQPTLPAVAVTSTVSELEPAVSLDTVTSQLVELRNRNPHLRIGVSISIELREEVATAR